MNKLTISIILILSLVSGVLYYKYDTSRTKLNNSIINNKAYQNELDLSRKDNNQFRLDIQTLNSMNDSITLKLKQAIKESKIKDKKINQLIYYSQEISKTDTILTTDTIFIQSLNLDTIIGDQYYTLRLQLQYPNRIIANPSFVDENSLIIYSSREYVKPRKKFWIQRIFQKKHTVIKGRIIKNNPYSNIKEQRFIEILK